MWTMLGWLCVVGGVGVVLRLVTQKQLNRDTQCGKCGYSREGGFEQCPECGTLEEDQRRVWRKKYRGVYVGVMVAAMVCGYAVAAGPGVKQSGWAGMTPSIVLVYAAQDFYKQQLRDEQPSKSRPSPFNEWWGVELWDRLYRERIPAWQLKWFGNRLMALRDMEDVSFREWEYVCGFILNDARRFGAIEETALINLGKDRLIACRDWWWRNDGLAQERHTFGPTGEEPVWETRSLWLLQGENERILDVVIQGETEDHESIEIHDGLNQMEEWGRYGRFLPEPGDNGYLFHYTLREDFPNQPRIIFEGEVFVPFCFMEEWNEEAMPANRNVLQSPQAWRAACNPRITGVQLPDGTWALSSRLRAGCIHDRKYESMAIGITAEIRVNGDVVSTYHATMKTRPFAHIGDTTWGIRRDAANDPEAPRIDLAGGDTVELVIRSNRTYALLDLEATSYWEGEVVIPVTTIDPYDYQPSW